MKKADYEAWKTMPLTKEVFRLVGYKQREQNDDFLRGVLVRKTNDESMNLYNQLVGYNKALNDFKNFEYEDLVTTVEEKKDDDSKSDDAAA